MAALSAGRLCAAAALLLLGCSAATPRPAPREGHTLVRCAGPAREVFAVGDFNGWKASGAPLLPEPGGSFSAWIPLPAGPALVACERHLAGGSVGLEPPLNAERVVDDGFGGHDGLFDVAPPTRPGGGS